jgi:RNA polymerase sigma-70 factor (ECF subfamily)
MRAWTFTILRNIYLTEMRRNRFRGDYDDTTAERILVAPPGRRRRCIWPICIARC